MVGSHFVWQSSGVVIAPTCVPRTSEGCTQEEEGVSGNGLLRWFHPQKKIKCQPQEFSNWRTAISSRHRMSLKNPSVDIISWRSRVTNMLTVKAPAAAAFTERPECTSIYRWLCQHMSSSKGAFECWLKKMFCSCPQTASLGNVCFVGTHSNRHAKESLPCNCGTWYPHGKAETIQQRWFTERMANGQASLVPYFDVMCFRVFQFFVFVSIPSLRC